MTEESQGNPPKKGRGRPRTRRSEDGYTDITGRIPVDLYKEVHHFKIDSDEYSNLGEILEDALRVFLDKQKRKKVKE